MGSFYIVSNLPIAKCRENNIINTNYFSKIGTNFFGDEMRHNFNRKAMCCRRNAYLAADDRGLPLHISSCNLDEKFGASYRPNYILNMILNYPCSSGNILVSRANICRLKLVFMVQKVPWGSEGSKPGRRWHN